jgi:hypothetical protein
MEETWSRKGACVDLYCVEAASCCLESSAVRRPKLNQCGIRFPFHDPINTLVSQLSIEGQAKGMTDGWGEEMCGVMTPRIVQA